MPKRHICQGDIFKFINDELNISQKSLCLTIDKVRTGTMVESRISEIKRGKRKGYQGLENKEDLFFEDCFTVKDEELGFQKVLDFVKRENLFFPGSEKEEGDTYESYSLRMLKYGLENRELPNSDKNLIYEETKEPGDAYPQKFIAQEYINTDLPKLAAIYSEPEFGVESEKEAAILFDENAGSNEKIFSSKHVKDIRENWVYIFVCGLLLLFIPVIFDIYGYSAIDIFLWMNTLSPNVFFTAILLLAISTLIFGLIDTAVALWTYKKNNKDCKELSYKDIYLVAKYGDRKRIIRGKGRYDLGISRLCYAIFCNIAGAFSSLALYSFLKTLKGFQNFIKSGRFNKMADVGLMFVLIVVFANSFLLFTREPMKEFCENEENPDTLRVDRLNVIANNLHIAVNLYFSYAGIIFAFIYGFAHYPVKRDISPLFALVTTGFYLYLWFSSSSPYAVDFNAQCAGSFLLLAPFVAILTSIYTIMCFTPSANYFAIIGINVVGMIAWLVCLFSRGENSILPVVWNNKIYFILYGILLLLFYILAACL